MSAERGTYADLERCDAEYRAGFSLGIAYAEADRRDYANADAELRAEAREAEWRNERAFRLGIVRGYRSERGL